MPDTTAIAQKRRQTSRKAKTALTPPAENKTPQIADLSINGIAIRCAHGELRDVAALVEHPRNPNQHPESQVVLLAKIIKHQGFRSPVVVSKRSGFVVAGHGRLQAARLLGMERVPVDVQGFATEADEWAHLIADNQIANGAQADEVALKTLLEDLSADGFDMELSGYSNDELGRLASQVCAPTEFEIIDENIEIEHRCPKCGYAWSGGKKISPKE